MHEVFLVTSGENKRLIVADGPAEAAKQYVRDHTTLVEPVVALAWLDSDPSLPHVVRGFRAWSRRNRAARRVVLKVTLAS